MHRISEAQAELIFRNFNSLESTVRADFLYNVKNHYFKAVFCNIEIAKEH